MSSYEFYFQVNYSFFIIVEDLPTGVPTIGVVVFSGVVDLLVFSLVLCVVVGSVVGLIVVVVEVVGVAVFSVFSGVAGVSEVSGVSGVSGVAGVVEVVEVAGVAGVVVVVVAVIVVLFLKTHVSFDTQISFLFCSTPSVNFHSCESER